MDSYHLGSLMVSNHTLVISRDHPRQAQHRALEDALAQQCCTAGMTVLLVPHLYHLPDVSPCWERLRQCTGTAIFASWLHPRPLAWLLARQGISCAEQAIIDLQAYPDVTACRAAIEAAAPAESGAAPGGCTELEEQTVARWYPVLDASRCRNCGHCRQFCLFGVYELDAHERVTVVKPEQCKPGCPACSRICPHGALMFPLYARDPRIAGAPGEFMTPDLTARKMYYLRTKQTCPQCGGSAGQRAAARPAGDAPGCPECGFPLVASPAAPAAFADIDQLIDELERLTGEKG